MVCAVAVTLAACSDTPTADSNPTDTGIPASEPQTELFVSLPAADAIQRIRVSDGAILQQTQVGMLPHNFLRSRDGRSVYVVLVGSQSIAEIDTKRGQVLRTLLTAPVPDKRSDGSVIQGHIDRNAFVHTTCFDCHRGGADGVKPVVVGTRPLGIAWNATGDALLVTNSRSSTLAVIDITSGAITKEISLAPNALAHDPAALAASADRIVVTLRPSQPSFANSVIRVMRANDFSTVSETVVGSNANHVIIDDASRSAYVSDFESNTVTRVPLDDGVASSLTVRNGPLGLRTFDGARLLSANYYQNSLSVVDISSGASTEIPLLIDAINYSNPTHIALSANRNLAYIVSSGTRGHVLEFDLQRLQFTRAFPIGGLPFDIIALPGVEGAVP